MFRKLIAPLLAYLLLLAASVWTLRLLWQQAVFTGALRWVMVVCAALLVLFFAAAALTCVVSWFCEKKHPAPHGGDEND